MILIDPVFTLACPQSAEEFAAYFNFRWEHLRKPLDMPLGSEQDTLESQAYHCMACLSDKTIVAVGRIHSDKKYSAQIRYMAVAPSLQRRGIGSVILSNLITYAKHQQLRKCWLKARQDVCAFYLKHGFQNMGPIDSELVIPHILMEKHLI